MFFMALRYTMAWRGTPAFRMNQSIAINAKAGFGEIPRFKPGPG
jgi:hypothetical protein